MWFLLPGGCDGGSIPLRPDEDADGWAVGPDCDDADPARHPGADEVCGNGVDDDCDLVAPDCGLSGEEELGEPQVTGAAGDALGTVLVGGPVPAATAPGVGVYVLTTGRWLDAPDGSFGAALASGAGGLLIGDVDAGAVTLVGATDTTIVGASDMRFGAALGWVGDLAAVGAPSAPEGGAVYLFDIGSDEDAAEATALVTGGADDLAAGSALVGGDVDGDGVEDLVVAGIPPLPGAPWVWTLLGPFAGERSLDDADASETTERPFTEVDVAGPCELDGDGLGDVVLATSTAGGSGYWSVDLGMRRGGSLHEFSALGTGDLQPMHADCGDTDGDGRAEVVYALANRGYVAVETGGWDLVAWVGLPEDQPATVAFAPDADGYAALLVGRPTDDTAGTDAGGVWRIGGGPGW